MRVIVQRSPFFTQSVAVRRSRRSLLRVMITSPTLAWLPSASSPRRPGGRAEAMISGASVEFGDQVAGGGEHDRVESGRSVEIPGGEGVLGGGGHVADVDPCRDRGRSRAPRVAVAEARVAAASAGSVKRCSSVRAERRGWLMSRRTPPAPIAASC